MATVVVFAEGASPERVLFVRRLVDPAPYRERTDVAISPDLSALEGVLEEKYWKHDGSGGIVAMTVLEQGAKDTADQTERDQQDQDALDAIRADAAIALDGFDSGPLALRALAEIIKDELNVLRALHALPDRTLAQLRTSITNKVNSGDVDS